MQGSRNATFGAATRVITTALAVLASAIPAPADACDCARIANPPCRAAFSADAVFVGMVTEIDDVKQPRPLPPGDRRVRIHVSEIFQGTVGRSQDVYTASSGPACGFPFKVGEAYLIYAYKDRATNRLVTSICGRTTWSSGAGQDLGYLRRTPDPSAFGLVYGRVRLREPRGYQRTDLPGARIVLVGASGRYVATADDDGKYELTVPVGSYDVVPELAPGFTAIHQAHVIVRDRRACDALDVEVQKSPSAEMTAVGFAQAAPRAGVAVIIVRVHGAQ